MVYFVYTLESPRWGDFNENTQYTIMLKKIEKIFLLSFCSDWLTLTSSNYPCFEHIFIVPKVFEPLTFDCRYKKHANLLSISVSMTCSFYWNSHVFPRPKIHVWSAAINSFVGTHISWKPDYQCILNKLNTVELKWLEHLFTTAASNSFWSPLENIPLDGDLG